MSPQPKQLALLISLIGAGVSPSAWARSELRVGDVPEPLQNLLQIDNPAPGAGPLHLDTDAAQWASLPDFQEATGVRRTWVVSSSTHDDWAPGEPSAEHSGLGDQTQAASDERQAPPVEAPGQLPGPEELGARTASRPGQVARLPGLGRTAVAPTPATAIDRTQALPVPAASGLATTPRDRIDEDPGGFAHAASHHANGTGNAHANRAQLKRNADDSTRDTGRETNERSRNQSVVKKSLSKASPLPGSHIGQAMSRPPMAPKAPASRAQLVLKDLIDVLYPAPKIDGAGPAGPVDAAKPRPMRPLFEEGYRVGSDTRLGALAVADETPSDKVLRTLGAILSNERDEVGAIMLGRARMEASQSEKVMSSLSEIICKKLPEEDGTTRRARKLAAAAARVQLASQRSQDIEQPINTDRITEPGTTLEMQAPERSTVAAVGPSDPAVAQAAPRSNPFGGTRLAVSTESLDGVRGGFVADGLNISFGIERAVYVNGSLVTTTSLNISDLSRLTAGRGGIALDAGTIALIQSGAGNSVTPGSISPSAAGIVFQNTLDGQKIQSVTTINASVNSLGVMRSLNLQSSLRGAVIDSLRR